MMEFEFALLVRVTGDDGQASIAELSALGAGPLEGRLSEFGPAVCGQGEPADRVLAFRPPDHPDSLEWLRRCRGQVAPGLWFWLGHVERREFPWSGPGALAAQEAGVILMAQPLPDPPAAWLALFAARRDIRRTG